MKDLKLDFNVAYDEKDTVGKRYRRQDAYGTPFCITVDHQSLEDNTVTIRHRDTMVQERIARETQLKEYQVQSEMERRAREVREHELEVQQRLAAEEEASTAFQVRAA